MFFFKWLLIVFDVCLWFLMVFAVFFNAFWSFLMFLNVFSNSFWCFLCLLMFFDGFWWFLMDLFADLLIFDSTCWVNIMGKTMGKWSSFSLFTRGFWFTIGAENQEILRISGDWIFNKIWRLSRFNWIKITSNQKFRRFSATVFLYRLAKSICLRKSWLLVDLVAWSWGEWFGFGLESWPAQKDAWFSFNV